MYGKVVDVDELTVLCDPDKKGNLTSTSRDFYEINEGNNCCWANTVALIAVVSGIGLSQREKRQAVATIKGERGGFGHVEWDHCPCVTSTTKPKIAPEDLEREPCSFLEQACI